MGRLIVAAGCEKSGDNPTGEGRSPAALFTLHEPGEEGYLHGH
jgi:hypothetical protein